MGSDARRLVGVRLIVFELLVGRLGFSVLVMVGYEFYKRFSLFT